MHANTPPRALKPGPSWLGRCSVRHYSLDRFHDGKTIIRYFPDSYEDPRYAAADNEQDDQCDTSPENFKGIHGPFPAFYEQRLC